MTKEEFSNLKVNDTIFYYSVNKIDILEYKIAYIGKTISGRWKYVETTTGNIFYDEQISGLYLDKKKCLINFIKNKKAYICSKTIPNKYEIEELKYVYNLYKHFIKENIEEFI